MISVCTLADIFTDIERNLGEASAFSRTRISRTRSELLACVHVLFYFFYLRVTRTAVQLWFVCAGAIEQRRAVRGEITNKETTFSFAPAPPGWPPAKFSREGWLTPSPPLLPLFFLFQTHIRTPLQPSKATGEKKEERQKQKSNSCNFLERAQLPRMPNASVLQMDHMGTRGNWFYFSQRRKQEGGHTFLFFFLHRMRRQKFPSVLTKQAPLSWSWNPRLVIKCPGVSVEGSERMPGCPLWSPICLSSGWASTGWCGARSAPPHASASRWSSLLSSASGSAWRGSARIPASRATTPRWSRRTGRGPTRSPDRASGSVSDRGSFLWGLGAIKCLVRALSWPQAFTLWLSLLCQKRISGNCKKKWSRLFKRL